MIYQQLIGTAPEVPFSSKVANRSLSYITMVLKGPEKQNATDYWLYRLDKRQPSAIWGTNMLTKILYDSLECAGDTGTLLLLNAMRCNFRIKLLNRKSLIIEEFKKHK